MAQELVSVKSAVCEVQYRHSFVRRSLLEVDMALLKKSRVPSRVTELTRVSNLGFKVVIARLSALEKKGLIEGQRLRLCHSGLKSSPRFSKFRVYSTTPAGLDLVCLWIKFQKAYGDKIA